MSFGPLEYAAYLQRGRPAAVALAVPVCVRALISTRAASGVVQVDVRQGTQPLVLVLSSSQPVAWQVELERGARLAAVLFAGAAESTVRGAGDAPVASIGGFDALRRGPMESRHLEDEVMRCTRREIRDFRSQSADSRFEVDSY